jgi:hypothetical protein
LKGESRQLWKYLIAGSHAILIDTEVWPSPSLSHHVDARCVPFSISLVDYESCVFTVDADGLPLPATPIALKIAVSVGIGMLVGFEREWSNKDVGVRTFAIVALLGMIASVVSPAIAVTAFIGVFLLVAAMTHAVFFLTARSKSPHLLRFF